MITGTIVNAGRLVFQGELVGGRVETRAGGIQAGLDAVPDELRHQLGTMTIEKT